MPRRQEEGGRRKESLKKYEMLAGMVRYAPFQLGTTPYHFDDELRGDRTFF